MTEKKKKHLVKGITLSGKVLSGSSWPKLISQVPYEVIIPIKQNGCPVDLESFDFNKFYKPIIKRHSQFIKDILKYE
jgi:hypothetical protein